MQLPLTIHGNSLECMAAGKRVAGIKIAPIHRILDNPKPRTGAEMSDRRFNAKSFAPIGDVLGRVLQKHQPARNQALMGIWQVWDEAVGEGIASNARPAAFKKDLLLLHVSNSAWLHHLRFMEPEIIEKVNAALGGKYIRRIQMKIGAI